MAVLTVRKRKLVKGIVAGIQPTQAARAAGYAESTATHGITKLMAGAPFRAALGQSLRRAGITDKRLWAGLDKGLDAMETRYFADKGVVTDTRDVIAWGPRHQHLETALRLKGYLGRESADDAGDTRPAVSITLLWPGQVVSEPAAVRQTLPVVVIGEANSGVQTPAASNTAQPEQCVMDSRASGDSPGTPKPAGDLTIPPPDPLRHSDNNPLCKAGTRRPPSGPSAHEQSMVEVEAFLASEVAAGRA